MSTAAINPGTLVVVNKTNRSGYFTGTETGVARASKDGKVKVETARGAYWYSARNVSVDHAREAKRARAEAEAEARAAERKAARAEAKAEALAAMTPAEREALAIFRAEMENNPSGIFTYEPDALTEVQVNVPESEIRVERYRNADHLTDPLRVEEYVGLYGCYGRLDVETQFIKILTAGRL